MMHISGLREQGFGFDTVYKRATAHAQYYNSVSASSSIRLLPLSVLVLPYVPFSTHRITLPVPCFVSLRPERNTQSCFGKMLEICSQYDNSFPGTEEAPSCYLSGRRRLWSALAAITAAWRSVLQIQRTSLRIIIIGERAVAETVDQTKKLLRFVGCIEQDVFSFFLPSTPSPSRPTWRNRPQTRRRLMRPEPWLWSLRPRIQILHQRAVAVEYRRSTTPYPTRLHDADTIPQSPLSSAWA